MSQRKKRRPFFTEREKIAWELRHRGWTLRRIARHQHVSESAIWQRLRRLEKRFAGRLWTGHHIPRRRVRLMSLSDVQNV